MKLLLILAVFSISFANAQTLDSIPETKNSDTILPIRSLDSLNVLKSRDISKIVIVGDTTKIFQVLDSSKIEKLVRIRKSLLDSLLSPYYKITYDTVAKDTLYSQRYRMVVNEITNDTTFIPIPKKKKHVRARRRLVFDTRTVI